jgi:alpha-1,3-rhamnosyl/mannosyltransferase
MKYFVEAHTILKNKSGVGWFTHGLVKGMQAELAANDSIRLITHPSEPMDVADLLVHKQTLDQPIDWMPARLYHALKFRNAMPPLDAFFGKGIYIFPNFIRWPLLRSPAIIVVHDLSMFDVPEYSAPKNLEFMTKHLPSSIAKSSMIVAVSECTKKTLCEKFDVDPEKVIVAHLAAEDDQYHRTDQEIAEAKIKYGIFGKYLFFVSTLEPRKNVDGIVNAYCALPKKIRDEYTLVLAGGRGWRDETIRETIHQAQLAGEKIITTGYIDIDDKPALLSGAAALVFPSHYEGFGLPVLESMSCGTPVITADNSSLREVGGDAVLYVDSTNQKQLTDTIVQLLGDKKLQEKLIAAGYKQAKKFTWSKCAKKVLEGIEKLKIAP